MNSHEQNADRFTGFADIYDGARPHCPPQATAAIETYLGKKPETVVDLGCGTGLSTLAWAGCAERVIGVEPSGDMIAVARAKAEGAGSVEFRRAFANDTGLPDSCADAVTCSQSFHWMEPVSTLAEIARILRPGGVFAAYDYDWPPVCGARAELAFLGLSEAVDRLEADFCPQDPSSMWDKDGHLDRIRGSGHFVYARELLFSSSEPCTARRLAALAASRSGFQKALAAAPEKAGPLLREFLRTAQSLFGDGEFSVDFCYRMRIGVKG